MDGPPVYFFSDAHFGSHGPAQEELKVQRFHSLLQQAGSCRAEVFFLGDLFDFWFEYRHWIPKVQLDVLAAIRAFTRAGGTFHLIAGNHDFWAGEYFEKELGITLHLDDITLVRQGMRLHIAHGDGKAPSEIGYRLLRRVLRFRPNVMLYRLIPADWAYRLARFSSGRSRELNTRRPNTDFSEYDQAARAILSSGFDAVIMGHLHNAWVRRIDGGWWINSGEFYESFDYIILENGGFRLESWQPADDAAGVRPAPGHTESPSAHRPE